MHVCHLFMCLLRCIRWHVDQSTTWLLLVSQSERTVISSEACMVHLTMLDNTSSAVCEMYAACCLSRCVNAVHARDKD